MIDRRLTPKRAWPRGKEEELTALCQGETKYSASQIGLKIGFSRSAVIGKAHRMGLQLPVNHGQHPGAARDTTSARSKIPAQKAREAVKEDLQGFSDTLDPETEETPPRGSQCRFPLWDLGKPDGRFCPNKKVQGSYCQEHYDLCHNTGAPRIGWQ